jgi:hypothetical protein
VSQLAADDVTFYRTLEAAASIWSMQLPGISATLDLA